MKSSKSRFASLVLAGKLAAAALPFALAPGAGTAAPLTRVSVEIQFNGNQAIAGHLRAILPGQLAQELAGRPLTQFPPGSRLVVRIREIFLATDYGGGGFRGSKGSVPVSDAIDGDALIVDARGAVLTRKPIAGRSHPSAGGRQVPFNEPARVEALSATLAYWVVREFN